MTANLLQIWVNDDAMPVRNELAARQCHAMSIRSATMTWAQENTKQQCQSTYLLFHKHTHKHSSYSYSDELLVRAEGTAAETCPAYFIQYVAL